MNQKDFIYATANSKIKPYGSVTVKKASWWERLKHKLSFGWLGAKYIAEQKVNMAEQLDEEQLKEESANDNYNVVGFALQDSDGGNVTIEIE